MQISKNKKISAFTIAEVMIVFAAIAFIMVFLAKAGSNISNTRGDKLGKKALNQVEQIVSEIYSNDIAYSQDAVSGVKKFKNTSEARVNDRYFSGNDKFCKLFASNFDGVDLEKVECKEIKDDYTIDDLGKPSFATSDGIQWWLPSSDFSNEYAIIYVDVDPSGADCEPYKDDPNYPNNKYCADGKSIADRFKFYVNSNGKINLKKSTDEVSASSYKINLKIVTKDEDGNITQEVYGQEGDGGKVTITEGANADAESELLVTNLKKGQQYTLFAIPNTDYHSSWSNNIKRKTMNKRSYNIYVEFYKYKTSCIGVRINNSNALEDSHIPVKQYKSGCLYKENDEGEYYKGNGIGEYMRCPNSTCDGKQKYSYDCDSEAVDLELKEGSADTFEACGLQNGDYQLILESDGIYIFSNSTTKYSQNVRLGSEPIYFDVETNIGSGQCGARKYKNTSTGECEDCPANCIKCISSTICAKSDIGYYVSEGNCVQCASHCTACGDRGVCTLCEDKYTLTNGQCCKDSSCYGTAAQ